MSVLLKRSTSPHIPLECIYGCCTIMYGTNVPKIRRRVKRSEKRAWKRDVKNEIS